jgi:hypothetical protein
MDTEIQLKANEEHIKQRQAAKAAQAEKEKAAIAPPTSPEPSHGMQAPPDAPAAKESPYSEEGLNAQNS